METLFDIPLWENIQDELAALTGTAIITVDYRGQPLTRHSRRTSFCSVIRENPVSKKRCFRCDALAGLEAIRLERPYIYLCHCGIVDVAVPVQVGDKYLGAVMFGQVRVQNDSTEAKVERLVSEISSFQPDNDASRQDLMEMYNQLPHMKYSRIVEIANAINAIVTYIVDQAVRRDHDRLTYEWLLKGGDRASANAHTDIQEIWEPVSDVSNDSRALSLPKSSPVYLAVKYIHDHQEKKIVMKEMAQLCRLTPSYFSRLFQRELGENFIDYVNRQKIQTAKFRLRSTSDSVAHIATSLGYADASYFINVFKKYEGVTPLMYRQQYHL